MLHLGMRTEQEIQERIKKLELQQEQERSKDKFRTRVELATLRWIIEPEIKKKVKKVYQKRPPKIVKNHLAQRAA